MDAIALRFGLWLGVMGAVLVVAGYVIWYLRERLMMNEDDQDDGDDAVLYTTAEVERLKREGLVDESQYAKLRSEALEAGKRRAQRAGKRGNKKRGLFG